MGTHPDFHFTRAMHAHRERAREAENLLREIQVNPGRWALQGDLLGRINAHLKGDKT